MPGLLQTPDHEAKPIKVFYACLAEFIGVAIFAFYGSATSLNVSPFSVTNNAFGNGAALSLVVYITANISGGHVNPAVTIATLVTGHTSLARSVMYIFCQIAGSILGSLMLAGLLNPHIKVGTAEFPAGCFGKTDVTGIQLFGWEAITTFVLVSAVYAVAVGEPQFGIMGPAVVGLSLFAAVEAGGQYVGGGLNPARVLGPACVFGCNWGQVWIYVLAEILGGLIAGAFSLPLYGEGEAYGDVFKVLGMSRRLRGSSGGQPQSQPQSQRGNKRRNVSDSIVSTQELDLVSHDNNGSSADAYPGRHVV